MKTVKSFCLVVSLVLAISLVGTTGQAAPVTSLPSGATVIPMPEANYQGQGPQTFGPGITWTSTNTQTAPPNDYDYQSVFGFTGYYYYGDNGYWNGTLGPMAGLNDDSYSFDTTDYMTFAFATPVQGVGGFLNYFKPGGPGTRSPTTIAVYDSSHNLIESYTLTFTTGGGPNTGAFYGFLESTPNISYFTLTDNEIGITNLTVLTGTPLPTHRLTVTVSGNGSVTSTLPGINCGTGGSSCSASFTAGTVVTLTPTADPQNIFAGYSNCDAPSCPSCNMTMDADKSITVNFWDQCQIRMRQMGYQP